MGSRQGDAEMLGVHNHKVSKELLDLRAQMQLRLSQALLLSLKTPTTFVVELKQGQVRQALHMLQPCRPSTTCCSCVTGPFLLYASGAINWQQDNRLHA